MRICLLFGLVLFSVSEHGVLSSLVAADRLAEVQAGIDAFPDPVAHLRYVFCPQLQAVGLIMHASSFVTPLCYTLSQVLSD